MKRNRKSAIIIEKDITSHWQNVTAQHSSQQLNENGQKGNKIHEEKIRRKEIADTDQHTKEVWRRACVYLCNVYVVAMRDVSKRSRMLFVLLFRILNYFTFAASNNRKKYNKTTERAEHATKTYNEIGCFLTFF